jgi:integrase
VLARDNAPYGIPDRQYVTSVSKAQMLSQVDLCRIGDPYVRMSLELQRAFGLRREEALKLRPRDADRGDRLLLKASWTKGGKAREIPIHTTTQREVLDRAQQLAG